MSWTYARFRIHLCHILTCASGCIWTVHEDCHYILRSDLMKEVGFTQSLMPCGEPHIENFFNGNCDRIRPQFVYVCACMSNRGRMPAASMLFRSSFSWLNNSLSLESCLFGFPGLLHSFLLWLSQLGQMHFHRLVLHKYQLFLTKHYRSCNYSYSCYQHKIILSAKVLGMIKNIYHGEGN